MASKKNNKKIVTDVHLRSVFSNLNTRLDNLVLISVLCNCHFASTFSLLSAASLSQIIHVCSSQ